MFLTLQGNCSRLIPERNGDLALFRVDRGTAHLSEKHIAWLRHDGGGRARLRCKYNQSADEQMSMHMDDGVGRNAEHTHHACML